jgi:rod shape determining protein RodA
VTNRLWQQLAIATNWPVLAAVTLLSGLGVLSVWSNSPADGTKQLYFLFVALGAMLAVQAINYLNLGRWAWGLYVLSLLLIIYTLLGAAAETHHHSLPGVHAINKVHCWITFAGFSFEPSELMKLSYVMVLARYLRFRSNYRTLRGLLPPLVLTLLPMALILKQPALGVATLFFPTLMAMLFVAGAKIRHLAAVIGIGI